MGKLYRSARGVMVDMETLILQQENAIALGNTNMNARGDIIGRGGQVVKTRDEIVQEYYQGNPNAVQQVSIKDELPENFFETPQQALARMKAEQADGEVPQEDAPRKRKIVEKED